MASPFSSLLEQVNQFAAERTAQQQAGFNIEAQLLERQAQQTRQNLAAQFLSKTDFSRDPAGSLRMLAAITNDTGLIKTSLDYDLKTKAFERQLQSVKALQEAIAGGDLTGIAQAAVGAEAEGLAGQAIALSKKKEDPLDQLYKQKQIEQAQQRIATSRAAEERIRKETPLAGEAGAKARSIASKQGGVVVENQVKLADLQVVDDDLARLNALYEKIPPEVLGPIAGRTIGSLAKELQTSPELKAYVDTRNAYLSGLSRFLGEKGALAQSDVERSKAVLGDTIDNPKTYALKKQQLRGIIESRRTQYQNTIKQLSEGKTLTPIDTQAAMEEAINEDENEFSDENLDKKFQLLNLPGYQ